MGTISRAKAHFGLTAAGAPTKTKVVGSVTIGQAQDSIDFADADIAYSFKITSTGIGDVATLTISSGAVAQTTGTPTIEDAGSDFEGETIPTMVTLYALLLQFGTEEAGSVTISCSSGELPDFVTDLPGVIVPYLIPEGTASLGTLAATFAASTDSLTVTVIGKSS